MQLFGLHINVRRNLINPGSERLKFLQKVIAVSLMVFFINSMIV